MRARRRVGAERLSRIIDEKVVMLLGRSDVREVDVVLDASLIKAWSIRHPRDSRRGFSDPDAWVGRHGRGYDLGYKFHVSVDHRTILPLASVLAPTNDNEKRYGPMLVERTKQILRMAGVKLRRLRAQMAEIRRRNIYRCFKIWGFKASYKRISLKNVVCV